MHLCIKNANEHLAQNAGRLGREFAALEELAQLLGLPQAPEYIESYDISHTFGADNVAGMVVFHNGRPMKKAYKKFAIKGFDGQNDVGSMQEVLQRRFTHYREDPEDSTFKILPDLILLDGGDAQVHAVLPVLAGMHIDVPVFGMVKDSKHRTRAISTGGGEIQINANRQSFTLVSSIQEEVHRFAVSYHHQKHKKSAFNSTLLQIEGIGPAKAKALLKTLCGRLPKSSWLQCPVFPGKMPRPFTPITTVRQRRNKHCHLLQIVKIPPGDLTNGADDCIMIVV